MTPLLTAEQYAIQLSLALTSRAVAYGSPHGEGTGYLCPLTIDRVERWARADVWPDLGPGEGGYVDALEGL
jgi:hypothetical protein